MSESMGEQCQRCGEVGEDRRTLWMACFYAMDELDVPFQQVELNGARLCEQVGTREICIGPVPTFAEPTGAPFNPHFFTLRVCKSCRGSWLAAIRDWFHDRPPGVGPTGTGVFVRKLGEIVELTEAEAKERWSNWTPEANR